MTKERKTFDRIEYSLVRERAPEPYNVRPTRPREVAQILGPMLAHADREKFIVLMMNNGGGIVAVDVSSVGTMRESLIDIPLIFRGAVMTNCSRIIVAHNHPSGGLEPSDNDIAMTRRLQEAGDILGIQVLDHLLFAGDEWISFTEKGYMDAGNLLGTLRR